MCKSVLEQSYTNIECILVNDESTDSSLQICDSFAKMDERIKVIDKKNSGTSAARNTGLKAAAGDYVMFLDNDDYWDDLDALTEIARLLEESNSDVVMFNTKSYYEKTDRFTIKSGNCSREDIKGQSPGTALKAILESGLMHRAVWAKAIKREIIIKNNIWFPEGKRNEDTAWTAKLLFYASSYDWCQKVFYVYRKQTGSSQTDEPLTKAQLTDLKDILCESVSLGQGISDHELQKAYYSYLAFPFAVWLGYGMSVGVGFSNIRAMKRYAFVLKYDYDCIVKPLAKAYKMGGYYLTAVALRFWVALKR